MNQRLSRGPLVLAVIIGSSLGVVVPHLDAQSEPALRSDLDAVRSELERVRSELDGIKAELRLLRELLAQRNSQSPPPGVPARGASRVAVSGRPVLGRDDAPVTIVEFSDYQCPFCRRFFDSTFPALKREYIDTGRVRYVFRDFPLSQLHPQAQKAAEAARCAGNQGQYWPMHDLLFQNQQALDVTSLKSYGQRLGLKGGAFEGCLDSSSHQVTVQQDYDDGLTAGVRATPSFVVGRTRADDTVEGVIFSGARPLSEFRQEIERFFGEK